MYQVLLAEAAQVVGLDSLALVLSLISVAGLLVQARSQRQAANADREQRGQLALQSAEQGQQLASVESELQRQRTTLEQQGSRVSGANMRRVECLEKIYEATAEAQAAVNSVVEPNLYQEHIDHSERWDKALNAVNELGARFRRWDYYLPSQTATKWSLLVDTLETALRADLVGRAAERQKSTAGDGSRNVGELAKSHVRKMEPLRQELANELRELLGLEFENSPTDQISGGLERNASLVAEAGDTSS